MTASKTLAANALSLDYGASLITPLTKARVSRYQNRQTRK